MIKNYSKEELKAKAKQAIPLDVLRERMQLTRNRLPSDKDELIRQLLFWFKSNFFKWADKIPCQHCNSPNTVSDFPEKPTEDERKYQASVVEIYFCKNCNKKTRFPRYEYLF